MREFRDRVSRELDGLTFEEQHRWIQEQIALRRVRVRSQTPRAKRTSRDLARRGNAGVSLCLCVSV
jgi:hypothetical protein